jgi:hypothetical protein
MSKFNTTTVAPARGRGPITTQPVATTTTFEGAPAFERDAKSALFLLAVSNMVGEDTFYEKAGDRDDRFRQLVHEVALADPQWLARMLRWLRTTGNMRSASIVGAAEMVRARLTAGAASVPAYDLPGETTDRGVDRWVISAVCQRGDEPGELLAYWMSRYGRAIPKPVKRGLADAAVRLYNERALLKYDTASHAFRFADVIDLTRPVPRGGWQAALFAHALDRRRGRESDSVQMLRMVCAQAELRRVAGGDPAVLLDPERLAAAGMTWEDALSLAGPRVDKKALWEALIPSMGIIALARNLRNFDEAGVSDQVAAQVVARFSDPAEVARSRMFPFRWLSAYQAAPSLRWGHALDLAVTAACSNVPAMPGKNLVLIDTSASMTHVTVSAKSKVTPLSAGAVFGVALAMRGEHVDLHGFASGVFRHKVAAGGSLIRTTDEFVKRMGEVGHGTDVAGALRRTYTGQDRVFIVSDMQTIGTVAGFTRTASLYGNVVGAVPPHVPVYAFNLGGYAAAPIDLSHPNRTELGGLTDATFQMVPMIEAGRDAAWPF